MLYFHPSKTIVHMQYNAHPCSQHSLGALCGTSRTCLMLLQWHFRLSFLRKLYRSCSHYPQPGYLRHMATFFCHQQLLCIVPQPHHHPAIAYPPQLTSSYQQQLQLTPVHPRKLLALSHRPPPSPKRGSIRFPYSPYPRCLPLRPPLLQLPNSFPITPPV